jgi:hypothetical protein
VALTLRRTWATHPQSTSLKVHVTVNVLALADREVSIEDVVVVGAAKLSAGVAGLWVRVEST